MKTEPAKKSAPVKEKPHWLQFEFVVRQIGFVVLWLIILCALAGVFSKGYFSDQRVLNKDDNFSVEYERFNRLMNDVQLKVNFAPTSGKSQQIKLSGDFMDNYRIDNLLPEPDKMYSRNGELIIEYSPSVADASQTLWFSLTPLKVGIFTSHVELNNRSELTFRQFVYP